MMEGSTPDPFCIVGAISCDESSKAPDPILWMDVVCGVRSLGSWPWKKKILDRLID
jgi:hypothetical protein